MILNIEGPQLAHVINPRYYVIKSTEDLAATITYTLSTSELRKYANKAVTFLESLIDNAKVVATRESGYCWMEIPVLTKAVRNACEIMIDLIRTRNRSEDNAKNLCATVEQVGGDNAVNLQTTEEQAYKDNLSAIVEQAEVVTENLLQIVDSAQDKELISAMQSINSIVKEIETGMHTTFSSFGANIC